jgi:hypothetical protein
MKPLIIFLLTLLMNVAIPARAQEQQVVPYTLADRDRAIRTEIRMEAKFGVVDNRFTALEAKMDSKFDNVQKQFENVQRQIDQLRSLFYWGFGVLISLFLFNIGYTIWDRRTALKPALDKADSAEYRSLNITMALRDYAKDRPDLANFLKTHGLL